MTVKFLHSAEGDWMGLYIDEVLVEEGHSFQTRDVVKHIMGREPDAVADADFEEHGWDSCPKQWPGINRTC